MSDDRPWNDEDGSRTRSDGREAGSSSDDRFSSRRVLGLVLGVVTCGGLLVVGLLFFVWITTLGCGCQPVTPAASFDFAYYPGNESVRITHTGGDVFDGENTEKLVVVVDAPSGDGRSDRDRAIGLPFSFGDAHLVTDVRPGATLRVVWTGGKRTHTVALFEVPNDAGPDARWSP